MRYISDKWYLPTWRAASVADIDFSMLRHKGIDNIAVDVDSTLLQHGGLEITQELAGYLKLQRELGSIRRLVVATNRRRDNVYLIASALGADDIVQARDLSFKPFPSYYQRLLVKLKARPQQCTMIGDRLIQDIIGANLSGLSSILVDPVGPASFVDKFLLQRWRQRRILNILGGKYS